ncbi:MAG: DUF934 domain-containing protein [Gammaproteobacteria bacterium]
MALLDRNGERIDAITISNAALAVEPMGGGGRVTPLAEWTPESGDGLLLHVDDEPEPHFAQAPLIAIDFPAFNDGRGLSLAVLLRTRFGFSGELRAVGDVHPDIIHYMKRCGFDTFQMPEDRRLPPAAAGRSTLAPYSDYYQASVHNPQPAYRRVRRGA